MAPRIRNISADELRRLFKAPEISTPSLSTNEAVSLAQALDQRKQQELERQKMISELDMKLKEREAELMKEQQQQADIQQLATAKGREAAAPIERQGRLDIDLNQPGPEIGPLPRSVLSQMEQARLDKEAEVRIDPEQFIGGQPELGTPAKSIEAFFVKKADLGEMSIDEAAQNIQKYEPTTVKFTDNEGREGVFNTVTQTATMFKQERPASKEGKATRAQFTPEENKNILTARKEFTDHEYVKQSEIVLPSVDTLEKMISANPKGIRGPLQTQVSKIIAGEIGRLTDQDITRNVPLPDPPAKIREWMSQMINGDFANITIERYKAIMNLVLASRANALDKILTNITQNTANFDLTNPNVDAVRNRIGRGLSPFIKQYADRFKTEGSGGISTIEEAMALSPEERRARIEALRQKQAGGR